MKFDTSLIPENSSEYTLSEISKIINYTKHIETLRHHLNKNNVAFKQSRFVWTKEEIELLKKLYPKQTAIDLESVFPLRNWQAIQKQASTLGIQVDLGAKNRIYDLNLDYFKDITAENSYWAGFIAADGCLKGKLGFELSISLSPKDEVLLHQFKSDIKYGGFISHNESNDKKYVHISVVSQEFNSHLGKNFNMTPRKTFTYKPPIHLTFEQSLAFIKGNIDGDGSIFKNPYNRPTIALLGTHEFLAWVKEIFDQMTPENNKATITKHKNIWAYTISHRERVKIIGPLIKNSIPDRGLERKWSLINS